MNYNYPNNQFFFVNNKFKSSIFKHFTKFCKRNYFRITNYYIRLIIIILMILEVVSKADICATVLRIQDLE